MARTRKLPSGRWQGLYTWDGQDRSAGTFARRRDAQTAADERERSTRLGEHNPRLARVRFDEYAASYMTTTEYDDADTKERDASLLRNHIMPAFGKRTLAAITMKDVREWFTALPLGRSSRSLCKQLLGRIFQQAIEDGVVTRTPVTRSKTPKSQRVKRADRWLTRNQLHGLADAIDPHFRALILVMGYMGLRFGEVAGLTMNYLDLLHGTLEVAHSLSEGRGHLLLKRPKTDASYRVLELPPFLVNELRRHVETYAPHSQVVNTVDGERSVEFVFTGANGAPLRKTWVRRHFRKAAAAAGILEGPPLLRPHHLRHTCASLLIAAGVHAKALQEHLGHSSYGVTMDVYAHLYRDQRSRIAGTLQAIHDAENDEGPGTAAPSSGSDAGS